MAITLALSLVPLSIVAVGAVDLTHAVSARTQLQSALDAAALSAARAAPANNPTLLQSTGLTAFQRNLSRGDPDLHPGTPTFSYGANGVVVGDVTEKVDTIMLGLFSGDQIPVTAHSEVTSSSLNLEVALVLDNSRSMGQTLGSGSQTKIQALQTAADDFIDTLSSSVSAQSAKNTLKFSLVPFTQTVRLSSADRSNPGVDNSSTVYSDEIFSSAKKMSLFRALGQSWSGCLEARSTTNNYDITDQAPSPGDANSLFRPYFWPDEPDQQGAMNDYLTDVSKSTSLKARLADTAKYKSANIKTSLGGDSGPNAYCTLQPIARLSSNYASLKNAIGGMYANGDTYIPIGLVWGWHTLSPNAPFADGASYQDNTTHKIVVVMSDGWNHFLQTPVPNSTVLSASPPYSFSPYSGLGFVWQNRIPGFPQLAPYGTTDDRQPAQDARLSALCSNMRAQGIEIYAIYVGPPDQRTAALQNCATDSTHYYPVTDTSALNATFQAIARSIGQLHLSR